MLTNYGTKHMNEHLERFKYILVITNVLWKKLTGAEQRIIQLV